MTKQEAAVITAYTRVFTGDFPTLHEYIERVLGRPVMMHELASEDTVKEIKAATFSDFQNLEAV